jgi:hypothetical protein
MFWQYIETYNLNMAISVFFHLKYGFVKKKFQKKSLVGFVPHFFGLLSDKNLPKENNIDSNGVISAIEF